MFLLIFNFSNSIWAELPRREFSLRISGGYGIYPAGDFNIFYKDAEIYYDALLSPYDFVKHDGYQDLKYFWKASAELCLELTKAIGVSLGMSYNQIDRHGTIQWRSPVYDTFTFAFPTRMNIIPVKLSTQVFIPLAAGLRTYLKGGLGLYFVQGDFGYAETSEIPGEEGIYESMINASGKGLGLHGGLGLEYRLSSGLSVFLEGLGRSAKVRNIEGTMSIWSDQHGPQEDRDLAGKIWYFEYWDENTSLYLSGISFGDRPSDDERIRTARGLRIDLSGFSLMIGIKILLGIWD